MPPAKKAKATAQEKQSEELGVKVALIAKAAGCPKDQFLNFLSQGMILQPKQWDMAAAARKCDFRCPSCQSAYDAGKEIKEDCKDCGPTAVGVGGARGGGKSAWMFAQIALDDCKRFPGLKFLLLRKSAKALREQIRDMLRKTCQANSYNYREQAGTIEFPNGSFIVIGHFKDESEIDNYLGQEYDGIAIEELTTLTFDKWKNLMSCLRSSKPGWRPRFYGAWNWGGIGHCVPHGDVLMVNGGWKPIQDIKAGEMVWAVDENRNMVPRFVEQVHSYQYSGEMISVSANGLKMEFTKDHKIARLKTITTKNNGSFDLKTFDELPGKTGILRAVEGSGQEIRDVTLPDLSLRGKSKQPLKINGDDFFSFMGWYLSEGHALTKGKRYEYRVSISQMKYAQRAEINKLMLRIGISGQWSNVEFNFYDRSWNMYLRQFGLCREKYVPEFIKNSTPRQIWVFLNSYIEGDGHWVIRGKSGQIYTISKKMADDICELCVKCGFLVHVKSRQRKNRIGLCYEIYFKTTKSKGTEILTGNHQYNVNTTTKRTTEVSRKMVENQTVYCIGVREYHNFIIRQNGSVWVSGNCWVKQVFYDPFIQKREITTRYILATVADNRHNNPEYVNQLKSYVGWKYQSWYLGDPNFNAGAFFVNFRRDANVYPNEQTKFDSRKVSRWFAGLDYGFSHPTAFTLCCETHDGDYFTPATYAAAETLIEDHCANIRDLLALFNLEVSDLEFIAAGRDCFKVDKDGSTVETEYQKHGVSLTPVHIDRINAWSQMQELIGSSERGVRPKWFIHQNCAELITQIESAQCDPKKPNDIIKQSADKETGEGGDDQLESARNAIVMARSSILTDAKPLRMGNYKGLCSNGASDTEYVDIETQMIEAEELDMEANRS